MRLQAGISSITHFASAPATPDNGYSSLKSAKMLSKSLAAGRGSAGGCVRLPASSLIRKHSDLITEPRAATFPRPSYWSVEVVPATSGVMGEHVAQQNIERNRTNRKRSSKQAASAIGRKLLEIIVYHETCRIGGKLTVDDLVETSEIGDWKMPDFKMACSYAASQGWLIVADDGLTLTTAGLAAA